MRRERYDGVVAIDNREDGPEYCCRLGQSVAQAQEQTLVAPEVRMVPSQEVCGHVKAWPKIPILRMSLRMTVDCSVKIDVELK